MAEQVVDLLHELNRIDGQTIVLVTHDADIGAAAQRLIHMRDGRLVSDERRVVGAGGGGGRGDGSKPDPGA
jgi:putative ABC transport system ATP-binding protein